MMAIMAMITIINSTTPRSWRPPPRVGAGQMGSALKGSLQISCFLTEGLLILPLTYSYLPKSARAYFFSRSVEINYFCSGPISVDPICPQPTHASLAAAWTARSAKAKPTTVFHACGAKVARFVYSSAKTRFSKSDHVSGGATCLTLLV